MPIIQKYILLKFIGQNDVTCIIERIYLVLNLLIATLSDYTLFYTTHLVATSVSQNIDQHKTMSEILSRRMKN